MTPVAVRAVQTQCHQGNKTTLLCALKAPKAGTSGAGVTQKEGLHPGAWTACPSGLAVKEQPRSGSVRHRPGYVVGLCHTHMLCYPQVRPRSMHLAKQQEGLLQRDHFKSFLLLLF